MLCLMFGILPWLSLKSVLVRCSVFEWLLIGMVVRRFRDLENWWVYGDELLEILFLGEQVGSGTSGDWTRNAGKWCEKKNEEKLTWTELPARGRSTGGQLSSSRQVTDNQPNQFGSISSSLLLQQEGIGQLAANRPASLRLADSQPNLSSLPFPEWRIFLARTCRSAGS